MEQTINRGVLWKNKKKENDKQPDYTGYLNDDGKELYISGWVVKNKSGELQMSLSCRKKEQFQTQQSNIAETDMPF